MEVYLVLISLALRDDFGKSALAPEGARQTALFDSALQSSADAIFLSFIIQNRL